MITIEKIRIQLPKWWQVGLIIIAIIIVTIGMLRVEPEKASEITQQAIEKLPSR